jgi:hypothetical protein
MAFKLDNDVHMTTDTTGSSADYVLDSTAGKRTFGGFMVASDKTWYTCYDDDTPARFESGVGTYNSTTDSLTRTTIFQSSQGLGVPINWPGPGTRSIVCGITSFVFATESGHSAWGILNPDAPKGFPTKVSAANPDLLPLWEFRSIDSSDVNNIIVDNSTGQSGNVYINTAIDLNLLLRKTGGTDAERTMDDPAFFSDVIQLDATTTRVAGLDASSHYISYTGSNQEMYKIVRQGARDAEMWVYEDGSATPYRFISTNQYFNEYAPTLQVVDSTAGGGQFSTLSTDSSMSVTIPATGTWNIEYYALVYALAGAGSSPHWHCDVQQTTSAPTGYNTVRLLGGLDLYEGNGNFSGLGYVNAGSAKHTVAGATNSATYSFKVANAVASHADITNAYTPHHFTLKTYRTA